MLIDNTVEYAEKYAIRLGLPGDPLFYYFDYDERSYSINMEFQHFHPFYEMCIFLDEKAGHLIDGVWYDMRCCDIVCLKPTLLHRTSYPEGDPCKRLIIQFAIPPFGNRLDPSMRSILKIFDADCPIYRFEGSYKKAIFDKLNEVFRLGQLEDECSALRTHLHFVEFLGLIYSYRDKNVYSNQSDFDTTTDKIYNITGYIHSHFTENLSLELLAKEFYISTYYLSHQFKRVTGFSVTQYVQMTRIRNAQNLLVNTDQPITDIAFACGFTSFSQFNRAFNKFVGAAPSVYRKRQGSAPVPTMSIQKNESH
ncbi:MAG: AraC family transcriptional regulator [Lachnospiraceae bacterium]|nr:AraC family transcriptional regulator [Lachnospiraceae bacterium]